MGLLWVSSVDFPASHLKAASARSLGEEPENSLPALPLNRVHPGNSEGAAAKSLQSCPTLSDPIDGSPQAPPSLGFSGANPGLQTLNSE